MFVGLLFRYLAMGNERNQEWPSSRWAPTSCFEEQLTAHHITHRRREPQMSSA